MFYLLNFQKKQRNSWFQNFRCVLNVVWFLPGNSPGSEFYMSTFRSTLFNRHRRCKYAECLPAYKYGTDCSETSAFKIQTPWNCPEESIQQTEDCWVKRDQLDVTCFIISLFNAQHVSDVNTSILRSLRLICWVISWVVLLWFDVCWCYVVVWLWWCGIRMQAEVLVLIISLFNAQHVSDVNTSILRSLRLICWVKSWVVLLWFDVCWCRQAEVLVPQPVYGYHITTAKPQRNTNTHRTRAIQPMK